VADVKICAICKQRYERRSSTATNDGWLMRKVCYADECGNEARRRRDKAKYQRQQLEREPPPPPPRQVLERLYAGRRYEDDPRALRSAR
jgi:hypothetical protein